RVMFEAEAKAVCSRRTAGGSVAGIVRLSAKPPNRLTAIPKHRCLLDYPAMNREDFEARLTVILRDAGPGTVAELTDTLIAYLEGERIVYARLDVEGVGAPTEELDLVSGNWPQWQDWLKDWLTDPVFSV